MIKVADLEAKIREQAGEIAILQIREAGLRDDILQLQSKVAVQEKEPPKRAKK